ncbi:WLM domain-containing protein [Morchella snyderi]|nr:WLM domain-containing protein [Morchella snyderi]
MWGRGLMRWADQLTGLNIDRGRKICIRLRQPYSENTFLQLEDCVYTMLHELTHNLHGPHDAVFHACLKGLEDEYLAARVAGYSGEGFLSDGNRLGAGRASDPPTVADARQRALAAAEKRAAAQKRRGRPTNTRRPAGSSSSSSSSSNNSNSSGGGILAVMGQRITGALARIRAPKACGGETEGKDRGRLEEDAERAIRGGFRTQAEADEADEAAILRAAIELIMIGERQEEEERRRAWQLEKERERLQGGHPAVNNIKKEAPALVPVSAAGSRHAPIFLEPPTWPQNQNRATWTCGVCTLINPVSLQNCDACGIQRNGEQEVKALDAPPAAWPSRLGGLRGSAAARQRERARVLVRARSVVAPLATAAPVMPVMPVVPVAPVAPVAPVEPAREIWKFWDCTCCEATNDVMWPACATCGVVRVKVEA